MEQSRPRRRFSLRREILTIPNWLTMIRIGAIPIVCWLALLDSRVASFWSALIYGLAAITDFFDGYIARRQKLTSVFGKFLDPLADKLIVLSILVVLLFMHRVPLWVVGVVMVREITITGLRGIASSEGMVIAARPLGKYKTAFQMIGLAGLLIHYPYTINFLVVETDIDFSRTGLWFLLLSLLFSISSAVEYFIGFFRELRRVREARQP